MYQGKLDPNCGVVEDPVSAVEFPSTTSSFQSHHHLQRIVEEEAELMEKKDEGAHHFEEIVYLDLDDGASTLVGQGDVVGEKEIEMEVDDESPSAEEEEADCGIKRKRTIRVIIRSRAFI